MASSAEGGDASTAEGAAGSGADDGMIIERFFDIRMAPPYLRASRLYERKAVAVLWSKLTAVAKQQWKWKNVPDKRSGEWLVARGRLLQVHGPPGNGKSSAVFRWVATVCTASAEHYSLWIDCSTTDGACWMLQFDVANGVKVTATAFPIAATTDARIVVFDGARRTTLETFVRLMNDLARVGILVIVVSSEGVTFHSGTSQDIIKLNHFMPSWREPEYYGACRDDQFWKLVHNVFEGATDSDDFNRRKELLERKLLTAGYSARYMFRYEDHEITTEIEDKARQVKFDSLEEAVKADQCAGAVNALIARLDDDQTGTTSQQQATFPVLGDFEAAATSIKDLKARDDEKQASKSYPRLISAKATEEVVKGLPSEVGRLRSIGLALDNNAIIGYALEEQLKKKLSEANNPGRSLVLRYNGQQRNLNVSQVILCSKESEVETTLRARQVADTWIFIAGRQGAFDAVHILSNTSIRFVQIAAAGSHTFKLNLLHSLLQRLGAPAPGLNSVTWTHLEFLIIRHVDDRRRFDLKTPVGRLQVYRRFDGELWDTSDYRRNVQYATLDW